MRAAPPVSVRARGGRGWAAVRPGLPAIAAAAFTHWLAGWIGVAADWPAAAADATALAAAALAAIAVGVAGLRRAGAAPVELRWDGARWTADGVPGDLELKIDLPGWMLLRLRPDGGRAARWLAVTAAEAGAQETLLRAALHARRTAARPSPPAGDGRPAA